VRVSFCDIILHALRLVERMSGINPITTEQMAALIAWMLFVRVDDLVKDRRPPEAAALRAVLDKIINTNRVLSMRSRPLSGRAR
jgi:hypothetical protein